jgi:hypothetical protein
MDTNSHEPSKRFLHPQMTPIEMRRRLVGACYGHPRKSAVRIDFYFMKGGPPEMDRKLMLIEIDESDSLVNSIPVPACPGCRMVKNEWPGEGYTHDGETYCCQGCAEGTGCMCVAVGKPGFSRQGQKLTRADPRPGEQRSGAPAPKGELSGERDNLGTEEALDQGG